MPAQCAVRTHGAGARALGHRYAQHHPLRTPRLARYAPPGHAPVPSVRPHGGHATPKWHASAHAIAWPRSGVRERQRPPHPPEGLQGGGSAWATYQTTFNI